MDIKKCDRCGKHYELPVGYNTGLLKINGSNRYTITCFSNMSLEDIDLCPECYEKLEKFIENDEEDTISNKIKEEESSTVLVLQMEHQVSIPRVYQILDEINDQRNNKKAIVLPEGCRFVTTIPKNCDIQLSTNSIDFFKPKHSLKEKICNLFKRRGQNERK